MELKGGKVLPTVLNVKCRLRQIEFKKGEPGFTLLEVLFVIILLAILVAVAVPAYKQYIAVARASEAIRVMNAMILIHPKLLPGSWAVPR